MVGHLLGADGPILVVSPHLDDAVISAGATLAALVEGGWPVTVLTVFAGDPGESLSPAARRHHARCNLGGDAVERRRGEDCAALRRVGARPRHAMLPDAVYRRRPDGAWVCGDDEDMFGAPPCDSALDEAIAGLIEQAVDETASTLLLGPAGIGSHVDHVIASRAVAHVSAHRRIPLWRWRDEPYASWSTAEPAPAGSIVVPYSAGPLATKLDAVGCYHSQVPMLWPADVDWRALISSTGLAGDLGEVFEPQHKTS